jgi:hypothetical protein
MLRYVRLVGGRTSCARGVVQTSENPSSNNPFTTHHANNTEEVKLVDRHCRHQERHLVTRGALVMAVKTNNDHGRTHSLCAQDVAVASCKTSFPSRTHPSMFVCLLATREKHVVSQPNLQQVCQECDCCDSNSNSHSNSNS